MPELPEVEAVCRRLRAEIPGASILAAHIARPAICRPQSAASLARRLAGRDILAVRRRGKHILIDLSGGLTLHIHLRMTGDLYIVPDVRFRPITARAWLELSGGRGLIFNDPRALGRIHLLTAAELATELQPIGIEPLAPEFTPDSFASMARASRQPIKTFLLDQRHICGIGNIYAAEALFEARIHPRTLAGRLSRARLQRLHGAIVGVLKRALQSVCIAYKHPGRFDEAEWYPVRVYGRKGEPCERCRHSIRKIEQAGRSTYFCPGCQK